MHWGYLVVLVGTFLEGETVLVLAGFAAHRGYLHLPLVIAAAFVGTLCADQLFFQLGRRYGRAAVARRPSWRARLAQVDALVDRHGTLFLVGFRFLYGLRTVSPVALGASQVSRARFIAWNIVGGAAWALAFATLGWLFGETMQRLLGRLERYELELFILLGTVGMLAAILLRGRRVPPRVKAC